jgi:hypothetical protein
MSHDFTTFVLYFYFSETIILPAVYNFKLLNPGEQLLQRRAVKSFHFLSTISTNMNKSFLPGHHTRRSSESV